jgi:hypothetical protein
MSKKLLLPLITIFCLSLASLPARAQGIDPLFNPNNIIADSDMLDVNSMSVDDIQNFLVSKGSYLATYTTTNAYGTPNKTAAQIIYDAAVNNYNCDNANLSDNPTEAERQQKCLHITTVSPKVLIATIQKESSLIEETTFDSKLNGWALGYGCPDGDACNPRYKGFGKQVNSAALQFLSYFQNPENYKYQAGYAYTFSNPNGALCNGPMTVVIENKATAALYNYTPHVFNGNYNFYTLWNRYFPPVIRNYPDGTLLQAKGQPGVWLLENGQKRPFANKSALVSRFDINRVITVDSSVLSNYPKGDPIKFPNYSLVQIPTGGIYLLVNDEKRAIANQDTFKKIGFNPAEIISATAADLADYTDGQAITADSEYPTGALLQDKKTGGVYYVENSYKYPLTDKIFLTTKYKNFTIVKVSSKDLARYTTGDPVAFGNGELLKSDSSPSVYLIAGGLKHPFADGNTFVTLGYKFSNVITVSPQLLANYNTGDPVIIETATTTATTIN